MVGEFQISESKLMVCILLIIFCSCKNSNQQQNSPSAKGANATIKKDTFEFESKLRVNNLKEDTLFIPDSTINKKLLLRDEASLKRFIKNYQSLKFIEFEREFPVAFVINKDKSQYLALYRYYGDLKYQISFFEIGYCKNEVLKDGVLNTVHEGFFTENGIKLGISVDDLIKIKGNNYELIKTNNTDTLIRYRITDFSKSKYLASISLSSYVYECVIKNSKVSLIKFGFEYP